jgi:phosphoglycolate phosphatase-like HAD superfamily hydrolase
VGWSRNVLIDATISSDEVARGRPYPDMIQDLMNRLGVEDPQRVAKVGDTPADLEEGRNAGCGLVIGVTAGTHSREQLERYPHTHLIETIAELPALLGLQEV